MWDLSTGEVAEGADTLEALDVLETAFSDFDPQGVNVHPGLLHMYLHLMEMSPHPERASKAGDALRDLVPDAGHLRHMPTRIDVLCGHYKAGREVAIYRTARHTLFGRSDWKHDQSDCDH